MAEEISFRGGSGNAGPLLLFLTSFGAGISRSPEFPQKRVPGHRLGLGGLAFQPGFSEISKRSSKLDFAEKVSNVPTV
jgi:hypothetical protein